MFSSEQPKPFLFHCPIFKSHHHETPEAVSLVGEFFLRILESSEKVLEPCGAAGNNLRVIYNQLAENETKKDFAVCVKGLDTFGIDHLFCIDCHI